MSLYGLPNSASISIARRRSWEAHGPSQEGMCLCRRIHLDRVAVGLDRSIHLSPYLVAVGFPREFCRTSQSWLFFHSPAPWLPAGSTALASNGREALVRSAWPADDPRGPGPEVAIEHRERDREARELHVETSRPPAAPGDSWPLPVMIIVLLFLI